MTIEWRSGFLGPQHALLEQIDRQIKLLMRCGFKREELWIEVIPGREGQRYFITIARPFHENPR